MSLHDDPPAPLDVVYIVRPGENNEELRFSLRSLRNLPHGDVWIVGHKPKWVTGVIHVPGNPCLGKKQINVYRNVLIAATHRDTPDEFVVFNDDFFVTEPIPEAPVFYRGLLRDHIQSLRPRARNNWWGLSLRRTLGCLREAGIPEPLSYELHVPLPVNKLGMAEALKKYQGIGAGNPPQWRTLYGNEHFIEGIKMSDVKKNGVVNTPFHSTEDSRWLRSSGIAALFPDPSPYEESLCPARY